MNSRPSRTRRSLAALRSALAITASAAVLAGLAGCVPNAPAGGSGQITVESTDDACTVSANTAASGPVTFEITNAGQRVTEFYLLADDGLRIVGEVENIAPGAVRTLTLVGQPGAYFTICKPGMVGDGIGKAPFTITGDVQTAAAEDAAAHQAAIDSYQAYVREQVGQFVPAIDAFVAAYVAGDDATARDLYASSRLYYERIEPTASAFGALDQRIDYREVDARAEGLDWTGFHRMEKDLWPPQPGARNSDDSDALAGWAPSAPEQRAALGAQLQADAAELQALVSAPDFALSLEDISNGAIALMDEVAAGKVTGEEDWWSGTDLMDMQGNVEGARVAFGIVEDLARASGTEGTALADRIDQGFDALDAELAQHGSIEAGFVDDKSLTPDQVRALVDKVNAVAEPLASLTSTVLGL